MLGYKPRWKHFYCCRQKIAVVRCAAIVSGNWWLFVLLLIWGHEGDDVVTACSRCDARALVWASPVIWL